MRRVERRGGGERVYNERELSSREAIRLAGRGTEMEGGRRTGEEKAFWRPCEGSGLLFSICIILAALCCVPRSFSDYSLPQTNLECRVFIICEFQIIVNYIILNY